MFFIKLFKRKKTFKHYLILFTLAILFLITLFTVYFSLENHLESMTEIISNRSLIFEEDIDLETIRMKLKNVKHIESIDIGTILGEERIVIVVDKSKYTNELIKAVEDEGYHIFLYDMTVKEKTQDFVKAQKIISVMVVIIIVVTIIILLSLFSLLLKEEHYNVAIMKTIGYKNYAITKTFLIQISFLFCSSFLIGIPVSLIGNLIVYVFLYHKLSSFSSFVCIFLKSSFITIFIIGMIILVDMAINYLKIRKVVPTALFRE